MPHATSAVTDKRPLIVVSNREPYLHFRTASGGIDVTPTTGGVSVALDALMRDRGGVWIAHGAGDADSAVVDARNRVRVPPECPSYSLHRIWLSQDEERRYYGGFANEGLWPLCHIAHVRPVFRSEDWAEYRAVNARFAAAISGELNDLATPVFIQDYHLALVAQELRRRAPAAKTAQFWHIPWPHPDRLRMCPWRREIMHGLLANNLVAFQLERDRQNFLLGVRYDLAAYVDGGAVTIGGRTTHVVAEPIGVEFDRISQMAADTQTAAEQRRLKRELSLDDSRLTTIGVGVDRLDYTKGIPERLDALDRLLESRPDLHRRLAFVQIGVPSRSQLPGYAAIEAEIDARIAAINTKYGDGPNRGPIRYSKSPLTLRSLVALYRLADFCVVSSLHDGMNLIAKEFVAARGDNDGVLVLSEMTGAAQELTDALIINPYDVDGFARAIGRAIAMTPDERRPRMRALRRTVAGHDVFLWASDILEGLEQVSRKHVTLGMLPTRHDGLMRFKHPGFGRVASDAFS
jgi:trehalose-6-phosphate synthase